MSTNRENTTIRIKIIRLFTSLNLFSSSDETLADQLWTTRFYITSVCIGIIIVFLVSGFSTHTNVVSVHVNSLSLSLVEQLQNQFPISLYCPCTQTSIRKDKFLSITPEYHPVCSSVFVDSNWLTSLFAATNRTRFYHPLDFRLVIASQLEFLALLCRTASAVIDDAQYDEFASTLLATSQLLTRLVFETQMSAIIEEFQTNLATSLLRTEKLISTMIEQNWIVSALKTNFFSIVQPGHPSFLIYWSIYSLDSSTNETDPFSPSIPFCECSRTFECTFPVGIYNETPRYNPGGAYLPQPPPRLIIPGMLTGCTPHRSLLQSNLACFYDRTCLNLLGECFNETMSLTKSRFPPNTTVEVLFTELFLESLRNDSDYASYFIECAPVMCTYFYPRRFDLLHIFTTVTSIFGGLCIIVRLLSSLLVKFYRRVARERTGDEQQAEENRLELSVRIDQIFYLCKEKFLTLNLFESMDSHFGKRATRLYICLLIIGVLGCVIYTPFANDTYIATIDLSSLEQFERTKLLHIPTLICNCSRFSISYRQIMNIQPRYHQICSSEFLTDVWMTYFNFGLANSFIDWYAYDFRVSGEGLFRLLQILCEMTNEIVYIATSNFNSTSLITVNALSRIDFNMQTAILLEQFKLQTVASFEWLFEVIRIAINNNQLFSSITSNALLRQQNNQTVYFSLINYDNCSCATSSQCMSLNGFFSQWSPGMTETIEAMVKPVPGFNTACFPVEGILLSNLECFYDQSCIAMLIAWRSFDIIDMNILPLNSAAQNIRALDPNLTSRFLPNTTIGLIAAQLFIEEWRTTSQYEEYYQECAPRECTYTYTGGFDALRIIMNILGIWAGLSLSLKVTVSIGISLIVKYFCIKLNNQRTNQTNIEIMFRIKFAKLWSVLWVINVFPNVSTLTVAMQRAATRLYFLFLTGSLSCILLFVYYRQRIYTQTVSTPNAFTINTLHQQSTIFSLTCPCSKNSIPYDRFLSISLIRHPICSSTFVSTEWWKQVFSEADSDNSLFSSYIRLLASMCDFTNRTVEHALTVFNANRFISFDVVSEKDFVVQTNAILNRFLKQTPVNFHRTLTFITEHFRANQFLNIFSSNWQIEFSTAEELHIINTVVRTFPATNTSSFCSCAASATCSTSLMFSGNRSFPGLFRGCLPMYGLRMSTLECFFNSSCLIQLLTDLAIDPVQFDLIPLISSMTNNISTTIGELMDELFVEEWNTTSNYSSYFSICAPLMCEYSFVQRTNIPDIITVLLSVYGGLTILLRAFSLMVMKMHQKLRAREVIPHIHNSLALQS